ncbi:MAG: putative xylanase/chitin deacetylase [Clostridiales bacterium]|nr:putative xylanase/chitin deacetylase [Clostridiales bacterium]
MTKLAKNALVLVLTGIILLGGCSKSVQTPKENTVNPTPVTTVQNTPAAPTAAPTPTAVPTPAIDFTKVKPNETGKVMVVMFHNFIETYTSGDKEYTTTYKDFRNLLQTLYDKGYRLVNVNDFLNNNISVPAGFVPMIFTFDDGTKGQFNLVEENGKLVANKNSAVGVMEEFNKIHPDFGLKGTFYVNLGLGTFEGKGTVSERLKYLINAGFEIGNHTLTHVSLPQVKSADKMQQEVGGNQKKMLELIPGYQFKSLAMPFGQSSKDLQGYVAKGVFEGVQYENMALMEVGAGPTLSTVNKRSMPLSMSSVRATGIAAVPADLSWWLNNLSRSEEYVSDGNPNVVSVPKSKEAEVDKEKLKGKELNLY